MSFYTLYIKVVFSGFLGIWLLRIEFLSCGGWVVRWWSTEEDMMMSLSQSSERVDTGLSWLIMHDTRTRLQVIEYWLVHFLIDKSYFCGSL